MNLDELVEALYKYMKVREEKGDLSNVPVRKSSLGLPPSHGLGTPSCSPEAKEEFNEAKQKLKTLLNNYIDERVKVVIESLKSDAPRG